MAETVEIEFETWGNRQVITDRKIMEKPYHMEFILRFPNCFERDWARQLWIFYPEGDAPPV